MNRHQKKVLSIAAAIANLSFTCAVAGVATFAWFTDVERATSNNISIITPTEDIHLDYVILKYDDDLKQGVLAGEHASDPTQFVLPQYDEYIKERNKYCNFIVRANLVFEKPIDTSETEIIIEITKSENSVLKAADPNDNNKLKIQKLTSNVTQFKSIVTSYTLDDGSNTVVPVDVGIQESVGSYQTEADAMYRTAIDYFKSRNTPTTFISLMNGQPVDPLNGNMITLVPELYNVGVVKGAVVYLECSYNEDLVEGFVKDHPEGGLSQLTGDIELISFGIHDFDDSSYGAISTGKFIKMNDLGKSYDGVYLDSYITNSSQQILDGSKTTGAETLDASSGINTNENQKSISNYITSNTNYVYAANSIEASSLTFSRSDGTFKSKNDHYVGNNTANNGIISRSRSDEMHNTLSYDAVNEYDAEIEPRVKPVVNEQEVDMKLQYQVSNSKFAYFSETVNSEQGINLFRYHENDPIEATLTDFTLTVSDNPVLFSYTVGEYFGLKGVDCVATYTRANGQGTFTINVTNICSYVMEGGIELIPEKSSFTESGTKTITVSYSDRGETFSDTYEITITSDTLNELTISHTPTKLFYIVGETLDVSDLLVTGEFAEAGTIAVLPTEYQLKLSSNNAIVSNGTTLTSQMAGTDVRVTVIYTGAAARAAGYTDPYFTIQIMDYTVEFDIHPDEIDIDEEIELTITYNAPLTITITGMEDVLSFDDDSIQTTITAPYNGSGFANETLHISIFGVDDGYATVTAALTDHPSYKDSFDISVGNPPLEATITAGVQIGTAGGQGQSDTLYNDGVTATMNSCYTTATGNSALYRFYKNSTVTISASINFVQIEFLGNDNSYSASNFSANVGTYNTSTFVWTGSSNSVTFTCGAQIRVHAIKVTYKFAEPCTITFNANGGTGTMAGTEVPENSTYTLPQCTFTPPADRAFKCWEVNGHQYQPGAEITITDDTVIYAIWSEIYVVSFSANGGTGTMQSVNVGEGVQYTLPACGFTAPANKVFDCWLVGGNEYAPGQKITVNEDTVVTAQWKDIHTVTFSAGEGSGTQTSGTVIDGEDFTLPTCTFTAPAGKGFDHWEYAGNSYNPGQKITNVTSNITVTAIWSTLYTITFNAGEGSGTMDSVEMIAGTYELPTCTFTAPANKTFDYWTITGSNEHYDAGDEITITGSIEVTAHWKTNVETHTATITMTKDAPNWVLGNSWTSSTTSPATDTYTDSLGNVWTCTYVFNSYSKTNSADYIQIGSSSKPATSITFTMTMASSQTITAFSAKFGGFKDTAGTITLTVGNTTVGTGNLNASADVIVTNSINATGTTLTVTVTNIAKGIKCYYISYTY